MNTFNSLETSRFVELFRVYFDETTRAGLYTRQTYATITIYRRKATTRRKHINQFLIYTPVLAYWSNDYLKLKQYFKYILNLNLFKFNYLIINLMRLKNLIKSTKSFIWSSNSSYLSRRWLLYFLKYQGTGYRYLTLLNNMSFLFVSSPNSLQIPGKKVKNFLQPFYIRNGVQLIPVSSTTPENLTVISTLFDTFFNGSLLYYKEIYKLLVLLSFSKL